MCINDFLNKWNKDHKHWIQSIGYPEKNFIFISKLFVHIIKNTEEIDIKIKNFNNLDKYSIGNH